MIDSVSMTVSLSNKKNVILDICENTLITSKATIRHITKILGKFSSSYLAVVTQLEKFISYRPDPKYIALDSFTQSWTGLEFCAFPPFICIPRVIQKIWKDRVVAILITPHWPNQIWYSCSST